ncbi:AAA family ATPase [Labedella phragmitis]|uniref:AAA family ATPase n=1 Tax=Labedella phragmitis TaxID=2498849 RepID=A0A444PVA3_9MICO|nr:AAA family ATPase [Labedella phragmitis]RWZ51816.1 AAA family ATPase [Labedella phragmitis]
MSEDRSRTADHAGVALPRRILVAGSAGAGKSTLARELSARLGLPYTELDALYHGPDWIPREGFVRDVEQIVRSDAWVSEWQYTPVRSLLLERAELLVALDYSRARVMTRVVRRTLRRRIRRVELWNGNQEPPLRTIMTDREHIVRWAWTMFELNRQRMRALEKTSTAALDVRRFTSPRQTERWLDDLGAQPPGGRTASVSTTL